MTDKGRGFIHPLGEHMQYIYTKSIVEYFSIRKTLTILGQNKKS
jgi:hypothetical protein